MSRGLKLGIPPVKESLELTSILCEMIYHKVGRLHVGLRIPGHSVHKNLSFLPLPIGAFCLLTSGSPSSRGPVALGCGLHSAPLGLGPLSKTGRLEGLAFGHLFPPVAEL